MVMTTKEAIATRIIQICTQRGMAINALANISGVSPSTVYSMLNEKRKNPGIIPGLMIQGGTTARGFNGLPGASSGRD